LSEIILRQAARPAVLVDPRAAAQDDLQDNERRQSERRPQQPAFDSPSPEDDVRQIERVPQHGGGQHQVEDDHDAKRVARRSGRQVP
jgi:hypothetical protein